METFINDLTSRVATTSTRVREMGETVRWGRIKLNQFLLGIVVIVEFVVGNVGEEYRASLTTDFPDMDCGPLLPNLLF